MPFTRPFLLCLLSLLLCTCDSAQHMQEIDLSNQVVDVPADGLGHYVYQLSLPKTVRAGEELDIQMDWRTVGPADGRRRYTLDILLDGPAREVTTFGPRLNTVGEINLVNWLNHKANVPADFPTGTYTVAVRLRDPNLGDAPVELGFRPDLALSDGFYRVATVDVVE